MMIKKDANDRVSAFASAALGSSFDGRKVGTVGNSRSMIEPLTMTRK
jgi:hypothetical protein